VWLAGTAEGGRRAANQAVDPAAGVGLTVRGTLAGSGLLVTGPGEGGLRAEEPVDGGTENSMTGGDLDAIGTRTGGQEEAKDLSQKPPH
jgi:hypothetical protein